MLKKLFVLLVVLAPVLLRGQGHTTVSANTPRMVVGIVIENFNPDYIERFWDKFGDGGFKKLYSKGFICANHHYSNLIQRPSVNMATLSTGTTPSRHGIVNDQWSDRLKKREVNAITDEFFTTVGSDSKEGERSAARLMVPTLGDQLKVLTKGRSKVFSVALNDVSAVLAAGHAADGAYWMDESSGKMISSSYYVETFPKWAFDFNGFKVADTYLNNSWNTLLDQSLYTESISISGKGDTGFFGKYDSFPYDLSKLKKESGGNYKILKATPFGNSMVKDFAIQMIPKEQLGYDMIPDLLTIVFSSMDVQKSVFGPFSLEMEDTYLRLDRDLADLLKYLESGYGTENLLIYLTGLNSISYPAEVLKDKYRMNAGVFNPESAVALLKSYLNITYGTANYIESFNNQVINLDHELIEKKKLNLAEMQANIAAFLTQFEGIASAKSAHDLSVNNYVGGPFEVYQNNFNVKRSGDVMVRYEDGWQPKDKYNPVDYTDQTQIPLVWYGAGIPRGTTIRHTGAVDVVPTVAAFLGITPPSSCTGEVIYEMFKK